MCGKLKSLMAQWPWEPSIGIYLQLSLAMVTSPCEWKISRYGRLTTHRSKVYLDGQWTFFAKAGSRDLPADSIKPCIMNSWRAYVHRWTMIFQSRPSAKHCIKTAKHLESIYKTRGPWDSSLTWETVQIKKRICADRRTDDRRSEKLARLGFQLRSSNNNDSPRNRDNLSRNLKTITVAQ